MAHQRGRFYWKDLSNDREVAYVIFELKRPENTVRFNYTWSRFEVDPHRNFLRHAGGPSLQRLER